MTSDGYALRIEYRSANPFLRSQFYLTDPSTGELLLNFEAYLAVPAGHGTLAVATIPQLTGTRDASGYQTGTTNIFLIDIASGQATFVATSRYAEPNWPLSADDRYVIWTEDYCSATQGHTRLYERQSKTFIEMNAALWPKFTPNGLILDGPFGGSAPRSGNTSLHSCNPGGGGTIMVARLSLRQPGAGRRPWRPVWVGGRRLTGAFRLANDNKPA